MFLYQSASFKVQYQSNVSSEYSHLKLERFNLILDLRNSKTSSIESGIKLAKFRVESKRNLLLNNFFQIHGHVTLTGLLLEKGKSFSCNSRGGKRLYIWKSVGLLKLIVCLLVELILLPS